MNEQYNILFEWAEKNRNSFEPLYRKDARRHYNEMPFSADLLADFIVEVQSLLEQAGYNTVPPKHLRDANAQLESLGWYFRFKWIDVKTGNYLTDCFSMTSKQRAIADQIVRELLADVQT